MGTELIVFIILLLLLVLLELPISISIIFATTGFLLVSGQDLAIVAEQLLKFPLHQLSIARGPAVHLVSQSYECLKSNR